ncbi:MAG: radical SAM protein, partial [Acidobacteria bacterium]|nr:radical SAM protein [Acidobacteriota bacterium]
PTTGLPARQAGIARLAALSPVEREKTDVTYYRLPVRSVLNRVDSRRVGFEWSINPYRGCEFGCQYCYARYTHEYMELEATEFERRIYVKEDAAARLRTELTPERLLGQHIAIGAATDPYQPAERQFGVTRAILKVLLEFARTVPPRSLSLSITTKSNLVLKDADVLSNLAHCLPMHINMSVTTVNARLARVLEPRAPRPDLRLEAVRKLNETGIPAGVFAAPVLPGITDRPGDLEGLAQAAADAGAKWLCHNVVFLMPSSQKKFFPFLEEKFPRLLKQYRKWYARSAYAPEDYRKKISARMNALRARHGLSGRWPDDERPSPNYAALVRLSPTPQLAFAFQA